MWQPAKSLVVQVSSKVAVYAVWVIAPHVTGDFLRKVVNLDSPGLCLDLFWRPNHASLKATADAFFLMLDGNHQGTAGIEDCAERAVGADKLFSHRPDGEAYFDDSHR